MFPRDHPRSDPAAPATIASAAPLLGCTVRRAGRRLAIGLAVAVAYILAAKFGLAFAFLHRSATPVWPPTGIALAALLVLGADMWPAIFVGAFVANVLTAGSAGTALGIAVGNTLEARVGAALVARYAGGRLAFNRALDIFKFAGLAGLASPLLSATIGVLSLSLGGEAAWADFRAIWTTWWLGDATGALLVTPVLLLWASGGRPALQPRRRLEAAALIASAAATALLVFGEGALGGLTHTPLTFLAIPPFLWAAFRFGPRGAASLLLVLAGVAVPATLWGHGPFSLLPPNTSLLLLQAFLATTALTALPLAAVVAEWTRTLTRLHTALAERDALLAGQLLAQTTLRESEARLHGIIHAAMDAIISVDEAQRIVVFNAAAEAMFRCPAAVAVGQPLDRFLPPHARAAHREHVAAFGRHGATARRMGALGELSALRADGELFPIEAAISQTTVRGQKLFTVILRDITERKQIEQGLHRALADKDALLREVNHRVKNNLQMLCDLLYLEAGSVDGGEARRVLQTMSGRLLAVARLHEELYQSLSGGAIRLGEYLARLVKAFGEVYAEVAVRLAVADEINLDLDRAIATGLIVNELLTNAVKHGHAPEILVSLRRAGDEVAVAVHDRGTGLGPDFDLPASSSLGLRLVHAFARRLQARLTLDDHGGTRCTLVFPLHAEPPGTPPTA